MKNHRAVLGVLGLGLGLLASSASADLSVATKSPTFKKIATLWAGKKLNCGITNDSSYPGKANYVFKAKANSNGTVTFSASAPLDTRFHQVGEGGEYLVEEECSINSKWIVLSIGDDGRKNYFIPTTHPNRVTCDGKTGEYMVAGSVVTDDGIASEALSCCFE